MACYDCYDVNKNDKLRLAERGLLTDGLFMSKISGSLNRPASPASRRVLALCEARRPGPPCKVDCGAELHKAPARAELGLPEFPLMNNPG